MRWKRGNKRKNRKVYIGIHGCVKKKSVREPPVILAQIVKERNI